MQYLIQIKISSDTINLEYLKFNLIYKNQKRGKEYSPLGREQDIMQSRLWNLDQVLLKIAMHIISSLNL